MVDKPGGRQAVLERLRRLVESSDKPAAIDSFFVNSGMRKAPVSAIHRMIVKQLRSSSGFRSVAYLGICFGLPYVVPSPWRGPDIWSQTANSVAGAGVLGSITWMFSRLSDEEAAQWTGDDLKVRLQLCSAGVGLGSMAFGVVIIIARSFDWVSFAGWGWEQTSMQNLARIMMLLAIKHLAVAGAEELIFRGYGLQTLQQAVGTPIAGGILTSLFALAHGTATQSLLGQGALGLALVGLRLTGGSLWLPLGYHFAWNYAQTAVLGPPEWPSLQALHLQGPYQWMGRPGHPEPGALTTMVNLLVAVGTAFVWWHQKRSNKGPTLLSP